MTSHFDRLRAAIDSGPTCSSSLQTAVISYILSRYSTNEEIECFFADLQRSGCVSGMVGDLIYYADTHRFYDDHYQEIELLREQLDEDLGAPVTITGDLKNFFSWLAFEETAFRIAREVLSLDS